MISLITLYPSYAAMNKFSMNQTTSKNLLATCICYFIIHLYSLLVCISCSLICVSGEKMDWLLPSSYRHAVYTKCQYTSQYPHVGYLDCTFYNLLLSINCIYELCFHLPLPILSCFYHLLLL
jgi:hypothetical protein